MLRDNWETDLVFLKVTIIVNPGIARKQSQKQKGANFNLGKKPLPFLQSRNLVITTGSLWSGVFFKMNKASII